MKNIEIYFTSLLIGVTSAWVTTTVLNHRSPETVETIVEVPESIQNVAIIEDATEHLDELTISAGETFWGLHFDGILPCSKMLVRGGGHIVNFSQIDGSVGRTHFHVRKQKAVSVYGRKFTIEIVSDDEILVRRTPKETIVATVGD